MLSEETPKAVPRSAQYACRFLQITVNSRVEISVALALTSIIDRAPGTSDTRQVCTANVHLWELQEAREEGRDGPGEHQQRPDDEAGRPPAVAAGQLHAACGKKRGGKFRVRVRVKSG